MSRTIRLAVLSLLGVGLMGSVALAAANPPKGGGGYGYGYTPCKPGNGFGDKNHCHSGPPGQLKKKAHEASEVTTASTEAPAVRGHHDNPVATPSPAPEAPTTEAPTSEAPKPPSAHHSSVKGDSSPTTAPPTTSAPTTEAPEGSAPTTTAAPQSTTSSPGHSGGHGGSGGHGNQKP